MIVDLATEPELPRHVETDILIVGGGIAGLLLATQLRSKDIRVLVLESGAREQATEVHPLNHVVQLGDAYSGATRGRFRCLGGTSTRWGGALIPFVPHDLLARPYIGLPAFPVADAVNAYLPKIEKLFEIDAGSYEEDFIRQIGAAKHIPFGDADFLVRFAKWPAFKNRNVAVLFKDAMQHDADLAVWINSTATDFNLNQENARIESVTARNENGRSITVTAKHVAICAGAIETTRLLLLIDRAHDQRIFRDCTALGRYFYDHISIPMANIRAKQVETLNRLAGIRFVGSTMRSLRFEMSAAVQEKERVGSAFGHISFNTERTTGFDALRELLRSQQRIGRIQPGLIVAALRDAPFIARLAIWRLLHKQLLWPVPANYELHVVAEQRSRSENYISLSSQTDPFGLPFAGIRWKVVDDDCNTFAVFRRFFDKFWTRRKLHSVGDLIWMDEPGSNLVERVTSADVYHPGGSTRMGTDPSSAVVDSNLKSFAVPNLWISSTSTFPSGGGANPTLTLMLFTMRLADHFGSKKLW